MDTDAAIALSGLLSDSTAAWSIIKARPTAARVLSTPSPTPQNHDTAAMARTDRPFPVNMTPGAYSFDSTNLRRSGLPSLLLAPCAGKLARTAGENWLNTIESGAYLYTSLRAI